MPQPRANAKDLHKLLKGSTRAHHARVAACLDWLALHKIPAVPISTTGVPVPDGRGGWRLHTNPRQVGISDIMACVPRESFVGTKEHDGTRTYRFTEHQSPFEVIGQLALIEVKTGKATRTPEQRAVQKKFADAGALCCVIRDIDDLRIMFGSTIRYAGVGFE